MPEGCKLRDLEREVTLVLRTGLLPTDGPTTSTVLTHADVTGDELRVERGVARALQGRGKLERLWGNSLYQPDDLPFARDMSDLPDVFTHFRNKVSKAGVWSCLFGRCTSA